ncbi:hypothetical protein [Geomobilimonas luticola]|uniref:Uncharacterized protein n=1 Tax=Geomobilimonas luticola TaxID=1114878 RepID=A0ABS5SG36_9BACT|nr:hypothetical protein [Geomobilimonas luticola]MBT0654325.1 hypothetical protein [Geomobilimonas luticola]
MSLILLATVCAGFLATRIMLGLDLDNVMIRYPLAVVFAYVVFFTAVKLWLKYIATTPAAHKVHDNSPDLLDVIPDMPISGGNFNVGEVFQGGGGEFSGAGASGSFGDAVAESGTSVLSDGIGTDGGIGDAVGDVAGEAVSSALGDEGGVVAVVVFAVLAAIVAVVVGAGIYLVYEAPFILSEAAFEFVLAASLVRGTRRMDDSEWMGSVFKTTAIPFGITLALALLAGYLMHQYFPGVTRISELIARL